jgi:hypothetical protein
MKRVVLFDRPRLRVTYLHTKPGALMGRFGGGWQWKLGLQAGGRTLIVNLLVASLRFEARS